MSDTNNKLSYSLHSHYNFIKGRLAEAIVERLFVGLDMIPKHNGMEIRDPHLAYLRRTKRLSLKRMKSVEFGSDFFVTTGQAQKNGKHDHFPIEVKFSSVSRLLRTSIAKYDDPEIIFIFVDLENFYCATRAEIEGISGTKKNISYSKLVKLRDHPRFGFSDDQKFFIDICTEFISSTLNKIDTSKEVKTSIQLKLDSQAEDDKE